MSTEFALRLLQIIHTMILLSREDKPITTGMIQEWAKVLSWESKL